MSKNHYNSFHKRKNLTAKKAYPKLQLVTKENVTFNEENMQYFETALKRLGGLVIGRNKWQKLKSSKKK